MSLPRFTGRRIVAALRDGSSLPVLVDTAGGRFVTKLRGSAQGSSTLIAEVIVAELAEALDLPVPERVLVVLDADTPSDDRNDELADLLRASQGLNLGFRYLPGAVHLDARGLGRLDATFVTRLLWLDALVLNPDRTLRNPNLLLWNGQPWLIDHGAALTFQHDWRSLTEQSPRQAFALSDHVFAASAPLLREVDAALAAALPRRLISAATERVPDAFFQAAFPGEDVPRLRARYAAFLWKRLKAPRPFVPS